jgi:replicative DNA helicase
MTPMSENRLKDEQAERAVLDAIVVRNAALDEIADVLESDDFGDFANRQLFEAMRRLHLAGSAIDPITLQAELGQMGQLDVVGLPRIYQLGDGTPRSLNVAHYAAVVRDKAVLRRLRHEAQRIVAEADAAEVSGAELLERAEQAVFSLTNTAIRTDWISGPALAAELYPVLEQLAVKHQTLSGVATGFLDLDRMTRGFQAGDLVLLGARPSQGKTAFALQVALHAAQSIPVAFFSLEMSRQPLGLRGVISEARVDGWRLMTGRLSDVDQRAVGHGVAKLAESKLWLDESPYLSPIQARSKLRRLRAKAGQIALVVVDYVQLMASLPEHKCENKTNQVAGVSRALKLMAREFGTPFLVLSQLHRMADDKPPSMADLRDSGALEQDGDVVILLHRPTKPEYEGAAQVIVGKHRNGPVGTVDLIWRAEQMRFENKARI